MVLRIDQNLSTTENLEFTKMPKNPAASLKKDTLASASESGCFSDLIKTAFSTIKTFINKVTSLFSTIFFCYEPSKKVDEATLKLQILTDLKKEIDGLVLFFEKRSKESNDDDSFKTLWRKEFLSISDRTKKTLINDHFRDWALFKINQEQNEELKEKEICDYIKKCYRDDGTNIKKALDFILHLKPVSLADGKEQRDPSIIMLRRLKMMSEELESKITKWPSEPLGFFALTIE